MSKFDWEGRKDSEARASARRRRLYDDAKESNEVIFQLSQEKFLAIARRYADISPFCKGVLEQHASGRPISRKQAGVLGKIDAEHRPPKS